MFTSPHVDYAAAYENGWKDGQAALKKHLKRGVELRRAITSIECTIAWLRAGCSPMEAAKELELIAELLEKMK